MRRPMRPSPAGALLLAVGASATSDGKLGKVVQLLTEMHKSGTKEMKEEQVRWSGREQWCKNRLDALTVEVGELRDSKAEYEASIAQASADIEEISANLEELSATIQDREAKKKAATATREEEHKAYLLEQKDYEESVLALEKATQIIERHQSKFGSVKQESFMQVSQQLPENLRGLVMGLVEVDAPATGEAKAYEAKTGGVLGILEKSLDEFREKVHGTEMAEMNRRHNYENMIQLLTEDIASATTATEDQTVNLQNRKEDEAKAEGLLATTKDDLKDTSIEKQDTALTCATESKEYNAKQRVRGDELTALDKAIEILGGIGSFAQQAASFLQLSIAGKNVEQNVRDMGESAKISMFLRHQSDKLRSRSLAQVAERLAEDPFVKVRSMVKEMIDKLQKEGRADAKLEAFCKLNFGKAKRKMKKYNAAADKYTAEKDKQAALNEKLTESAKELAAEIAALRAAMADSTKARNEEKKANTAAIAEAKDGSEAVSQALEVLRAFYEKAGAEVGSFLQIGKKVQIPKPGSAAWDAMGPPDFVDPSATPEAYETLPAGKGYAGQQDKATGVLGILEVIEQDFARDAAETETAEAEASAEYAKFMQDSKVALAEKDTNLQLQRQDAAAAKAASAAAAENLENTEKQLKAAEDEYNALKPQCPASSGGTKGEVTFEERTAQRQEEIDSLKQALEMLTS
ncbi:unnamed protein product [Amoebophrya sp. A25]|nr:unnamed protein product [Amoebophrya sp. A25]|eukprot:GSA25T00016721001.1